MVGRPSTPPTPAPRVPDAPPPAPERSDNDVAELAATQRRKFFGSKGRASTSLSGGEGGGGGNFAIRFLGGAART